MQNISIRQVRPEDYDFILELNKENVEVLAPMDMARLLQFVEMSQLFYVALVNGERAAFLISLTKNATGYDSENYRWFAQHYPDFLYIDRIVIGEKFRGAGLGKRLYESVFNHARKLQIPVVTAEIDIIPYNAASLAFHKAMGFSEVGQQFVRGGSVKVSLQAAEIRR